MHRYPLWWRLCLISAIAAIITGAGLAWQRRTADTPPAETAPTTVKAALPTKAPAPLAFVGIWEGKLAVFRNESATPDEVYEVFSASLPKAEQEALAARIPVYSEVELQKLLEDYTG